MQDTAYYLIFQLFFGILVAKFIANQSKHATITRLRLMIHASLAAEIFD